MVSGLSMILMVVLVVLLCGSLLFCAFVWYQGDEQLVIQTDKRTPLVMTKKTEHTVEMTTTVHYFNFGKQDATVIDAFTRHMLPKEQFDLLRVYSRLEHSKSPRDDGYFEAMLVYRNTGGTLNVTLTFERKEESFEKAFAELVDFPVEIYCHAVGRNDMYIKKVLFDLPASEVQAAFRSGGVC